MSPLPPCALLLYTDCMRAGLACGSQHHTQLGQHEVQPGRKAWHTRHWTQISDTRQGPTTQHQRQLWSSASTATWQTLTHTHSRTWKVWVRGGRGAQPPHTYTKRYTRKHRHPQQSKHTHHAANMLLCWLCLKHNLDRHSCRKVPANLHHLLQPQAHQGASPLQKCTH